MALKKHVTLTCGHDTICTGSISLSFIVGKVVTVLVHNAKDCCHYLDYWVSYSEQPIDIKYKVRFTR